jgi:hypothetical protein
MHAGEVLDEQDEAEMQRLLEQLRYVETRQSALKGAVDEDVMKVVSIILKVTNEI